MENNNGNSNSNLPKTDEMAIASLVLGIVGLLGFPAIHLLTFVCAILAIVFANIAKNRIYSSNNKLTGIGLANAGMVLGIISIVFYILVIAACSAFFGEFMNNINKF